MSSIAVICSALALHSPFFLLFAFTFQVFGKLNKFYVPSLFWLF